MIKNTIFEKKKELKPVVLFITPPFTQLNTPYPATAYLKGFLNTQDINSYQTDLGIEVILSLFSKKGIESIFSTIDEKKLTLSKNANRIFKLKTQYINTIEPTISFLHDTNPTLAYLISERNYLPEASRFYQLEDLEWAFGTLGIRDKARHLATLYLEDISDLIIEAIDPHFGFSRYAERLGRSASTFSELHRALNEAPSYIDFILFEHLNHYITEKKPDLVAITAPFPGNLYSAFRCGKWIKENHPNISVSLGGGYANTELRSLKEPLVFDFVDYITLDDGEAPLLNLLEHIQGKREIQLLKRCFTREKGEVIYHNGSTSPDFKQKDTGTPDYSDLPLKKYLSVIELANPMHRLWSDGRWNKLTLAHGCYWGKCTFCDITLDYIKTYEATTAKILVDRIETLIKTTGNNGFHFVDEAAPPALMRELALEILRRKLTVVWWTNIRFEKSFTKDLSKLLAQSGCIAISGGLEVASDRLLSLIKKGVTVSQVATVAANLTEAGIMVHAYLMYGFPTQTAQETIDSLENVRQLIELGVIQSGYWHQFAMTVHSPIGMNPEEYNVINTQTNAGSFANNDLDHKDPTGCDHSLFSEGLKKSLYNYMHGIGFEIGLQQWFDFKIPRTTIPRKFIAKAIDSSDPNAHFNANSKVRWIGILPNFKIVKKEKKGKIIEHAEFSFFSSKEDKIIQTNKKLGEWISGFLPLITIEHSSSLTFGMMKESYPPNQLEDFDAFIQSDLFFELQNWGLIIL